MLLRTVVLFSSALLNTKHTPVFADVRIGQHGPYRFLVDTGAQTTLIDPPLAAALHLQPESRVSIVTQSGSKLAPATNAVTLSVDGHTLHQAELVFYDMAEARRLDPKVRGILGYNALDGVDFTLLPSKGRLEITSERPEGQVLPLDYSINGRVTLQARMGYETLGFVLDSGASHIVLFRMPQAMAKTKGVAATYTMLDGARHTVPTTWTADMYFQGLRLPMLPAAIVARKGQQEDGLLPASAFEAVHVDRARRELILVPKPAKALPPR